MRPLRVLMLFSPVHGWAYLTGNSGSYIGSEKRTLVFTESTHRRNGQRGTGSGNRRASQTMTCVA